MTLSIQDTLRLIQKMINEGHQEQAIKMLHTYLDEAITTLDRLQTENDQFRSRAMEHIMGHSH